MVKAANNETGIISDILSCEKIFNEKRAFLRLESNDTFEIALVVSGAGIVFDFGRLFNYTLGNMSGQWSWGASQGTSRASASKPYAKSLPKLLKNITDSFKAFN